MEWGETRKRFRTLEGNEVEWSCEERGNGEEYLVRRRVDDQGGMRRSWKECEGGRRNEEWTGEESGAGRRGVKRKWSAVEWGGEWRRADEHRGARGFWEEGAGGQRSEEWAGEECGAGRRQIEGE